MTTSVSTSQNIEHITDIPIYTVGIVDDHVLFAQSLQGLINSFEGFQVVFMAKNGTDLINKLDIATQDPDIILLDINMPVMNGFESLQWLNDNKSDVRVVALSMDDSEETIIQMLKGGSRGYLLKDIHPNTLNDALIEVATKGHYYSDHVTKALLTGVTKKEEKENPNFTKRELQFIELACTDLTYKEIANRMCLSPKTIDNYRDTIFKKLEVRSRIGLVLHAIKHNLIVE